MKALDIILLAMFCSTLLAFIVDVILHIKKINLEIKRNKKIAKYLMEKTK